MSKTQTAGKPDGSLAFFDIDGTLTDGFTIVSFAEFLFRKGCFNPSSMDLIEQDTALYLGSKRGEGDYYDFVVNLVDHYALGLKGCEVEYIRSLSPTFLESALHNQIPNYKIHGFAPLLVEMINSVSTTIAISGSTEESLIALTAYLGFQEINSTLISKDKGRYTGKVDRNLAISESKRQLVNTYLAGGVNLEKSFAFGDSVQDVPILEVVGNPFVMGGNPELQNIGRQRGWFVTSAGDDIVSIVNNRIKVLFGG